MIAQWHIEYSCAINLASLGEEDGGSWEGNIVAIDLITSLVQNWITRILMKQIFILVVLRTKDLVMDLRFC